MKKPFANIGKLKKQKLPEPQLPKQQKNKQTENFPQRPPTGRLKLDVNKAKTNIYDAVRKFDQQKQKQTPLGSVLKPTLTFKKNKILKNQNKESNNAPGPENRGEEFEESTEAAKDLPKPTPLFNRNKGKLLAGWSKQKPVISQHQEQQYQKEQHNRKRMAYIDQQQNQQTDNLAVQQQQAKKLIKPNLFKGVADKKPKIQNFPPSDNNSTGESRAQREKLLNNSEVYQQYNQPDQKKEKFNFQKMMNVEKQQINLQKAPEQQVSTHKLQKQTKRSKELSQLLNLQFDLYEPLVSISSTTPFEVYISKIKSDFLKNSCDEAFDQKNDVQSQTLSFEYVDFSNQCPQDYQMGNSLHARGAKQSQEFSIDELVLRVGPVIEQLIKPSQRVVMPPMSLLAFNPTFKRFLKCPYPTFVYYSQNYNYSLVVLGEKLYICEDQIQCALDLGGTKIAGLKNGRVVLWNGENDRASATYNMVRQIIQSQNFELPVYVTNDFDKFSPYLCEGSIVSLIGGQDRSSFYSLDSTGKFIKWSVEKMNRKTIILPKESIQFSRILEKKHLVCLGMKKRTEMFYLLTSFGIICWDGNNVQQRLQAFGIKDFYLPKRSNLVFCLTEFTSVAIFSTDYHQALHQISLNIDEEPQQLIISELEHQNREISLFYQFYLVGSMGSVYEIKIVDQETECKQISSKGEKSKYEQENGSKSKRLTNIIYQGVNLLGSRIQKIKLYKDLKCTTEIQQLEVDLSTNVNNLKSIILKNKEFLAHLMEGNVCLV